MHFVNLSRTMATIAAFTHLVSHWMPCEGIQDPPSSSWLWYRAWEQLCFLCNRQHRAATKNEKLVLWCARRMNLWVPEMRFHFTKIFRILSLRIPTRCSIRNVTNHTGKVKRRSRKLCRTNLLLVLALRYLQVSTLFFVVEAWILSKAPLSTRNWSWLMLTNIASTVRWPEMLVA